MSIDGSGEQFLATLESEEVDPRDRQIAELQQQLDAVRDARKEDAFLVAIAVLIALDFVWLGSMKSW